MLDLLVSGLARLADAVGGWLGVVDCLGAGQAHLDRRHLNVAVRTAPLQLKKHRYVVNPSTRWHEISNGEGVEAILWFEEPPASVGRHVVKQCSGRLRVEDQDIQDHSHLMKEYGL